MPLSTALRVTLLAALAVPACARGQPGRVDPELPAFLEVRNRAFLDMTVYVVRDAGRSRLGTVMAGSTAVFQIPSRYIGAGARIRFLADPLGGTRLPYSEEITIQPGERVVLTIPAGP